MNSFKVRVQSRADEAPQSFESALNWTLKKHSERERTSKNPKLPENVLVQRPGRSAPSCCTQYSAEFTEWDALSPPSSCTGECVFTLTHSKFFCAHARGEAAAGHALLIFYWFYIARRYLFSNKMNFIRTFRLHMWAATTYNTTSPGERAFSAFFPLFILTFLLGFLQKIYIFSNIYCHHFVSRLA